MIALVDHAAQDHLRTALVGELALSLANQVFEACAERDLLVRSSDVEAVTRVLQALGFEPTVSSSAGRTFASNSWPLAIDMHHHLFPHGMFRMSTDGVFSRAQIDASLFAAPAARMSDEDLFAHLIGHFVKGRGTFRQDTSLDD
ncbi:MAG: nucleotidyltransferase family protein [Deltaproteobacteria bacterium]|nr:nucleotidyltransferase family protein [Deltaproteobacteria bacterium]